MAVNPAYINMVGQPSEKLLGHYVFDVFPETPEREARITEGFSAALAGATAQIEEMHYQIPYPDELQDRWWTINCSPLDTAPHCFLC